MGRRANHVSAVLSAALIAATGLTISGQAKTAKDGVFTAEQATQGQALYKDRCSSCHGDDLSGGGFAPALTTDAFLGAWSDQKVDALFSRIKDTMPADKPGSLSADEAAALVALVLKTNGFPAGQQPLPSDPAALSQVTIAKP